VLTSYITYEDTLQRVTQPFWLFIFRVIITPKHKQLPLIDLNRSTEAQQFHNRNRLIDLNINHNPLILFYRVPLLSDKIHFNKVVALGLILDPTDLEDELVVETNRTTVGRWSVQG
jgi:hypothetical protein